MIVRIVRVLIVVVCLGAVSSIGGAVSASADTWTVEGGAHTLKNGTGEMIKTWTGKEWRLWRKEVQSVGECMGVSESCPEWEIDGLTPVEDDPRLTAEEAQEGVKDAREQGTAISDIEQDRLDFVGEVAGTLPFDLGANAISEAVFGRESAVLGVEIGNGLDQLFRIPKYKLEAVEESVKEANKTAHTECRLGSTEGAWENEGEGGVHLTHPAGVYITTCLGSPWTGIEELESGGTECKSYISMGGVTETPMEGAYIEEYKTYEVTRLLGKDICTLVIYEYYKSYRPKCKLTELSGAPLEINSKSECRPIGVPAPGRIDLEIEETNIKHGLAGRPSIEGRSLSPIAPSPIEEGKLREVSENPQGREEIENMFPDKSREENELEGKEAELYGPDNPGEPGRNQCHMGKPVNCATGKETQSQTDLTVGGRGPALQLALTYDSSVAVKQATPGRFGFGWAGSYSAHLELKDEGKEATVYQDNESAVVFARDGEAWTTPTRLVQATLADEGTGYVYKLPNQTALHFNSAGRLESEVDRNGNSLTMTYESGERLKSVSDSAGREITFSYNSEGEVESAKDPMGHTVKYTYESGNLTSVTLPGEEHANWEYKYDADHELTSETDGREHVTHTEYNEAHQVVSQTDPMSRKRTWEYTVTDRGGETRITEPNGSITVEEFNEYGSPASVTRASGTAIVATTTYEYSGADELLAVTDANGHKTEYGYDPNGNRTSEKKADGDETKWKYDSKHDIESETTPEGETTTIKRDAHGNPEAIERPAPGATTQKTTYKYDADGDVESMTDPLEHTWTYEYDSYGDRRAETDPEGNKRTWEYNKDSQEIATVSPRGNAVGGEPELFTTTIERDARGRPLTVTDPLEHETKYAYDKNGDLEALTDPNSKETKYTYDADNELIKTEAPNKAVTETEYDSDGQVKSQTDGNKHTVKYGRNQLEEVTEITDPLGRVTKNKYDAGGNLKSVTDPAERTTTYTYDPDNNLTIVSYSDGTTHAGEYVYDKDGRVSTIKDGTGTTTYDYDQLGRLVKSKDGHGDVVEYEYNLANAQTKIVYPNGKDVVREFDKDGRLSKVTDWLEHSTKFSYDPDSDLTATTFTSSTNDSDKYAYTDADQIAEIDMLRGAEVLASVVYSTRDNDGQLTKATTKGLPGTEVTENAYDENGRLTESGETEYEYDSANNPTKTGASTNTFDNGDELEKGTGVTYSYDELGERTKRTPSSGPATAYGYDQTGNLVSVERPKEGEVSKIEDAYGYNGEGLRTSQTISGITSYFAWDTAEGIPLLLADGTNSYIYGPEDLPIEQIDSEGKMRYLHHDEQGSTRLLTGASGTVEGAYTYTPYGGTESHTGTATTPLGYDGQYTNSDTGLIYLRARVYDPATAQFLSVDPLEAITDEPYGYAGDNPLAYGDSLGLLWTPLAGGAAGADAACGATFEIPGVDLGTCGAAGIASGAAAIGAAVGVVTAIAGEGGSEGEAELKEKEAERENCGNPATSPDSKFEWKGKGEPGSEEGSWFDPETEEYLRPHFKPSSHGPHYDYRAPDGARYRIYPDGRIEPK